MTVPTAEGLTLRLWEPTDAPALVAIYQDPAMRRWTRIPITTAAEATAWITAQHTEDRQSFAVLADDELAACVVLKEHREVGYWTAARARGRGIASRAVDALSAWAFATYQPNRLELRHQIDNAASCRVATKAGYTLAETLPAQPPFPLDGHLHVRDP